MSANYTPPSLTKDIYVHLRKDDIAFGNYTPRTDEYKARLNNRGGDLAVLDVQGIARMVSYGSHKDSLLNDLATNYFKQVSDMITNSLDGQQVKNILSSANAVSASQQYEVMNSIADQLKTNISNSVNQQILSRLHELATNPTGGKKRAPTLRQYITSLFNTSRIPGTRNGKTIQTTVLNGQQSLARMREFFGYFDQLFQTINSNPRQTIALAAVLNKFSGPNIDLADVGSEMETYFDSVLRNNNGASLSQKALTDAAKQMKHLGSYLKSYTQINVTPSAIGNMLSNNLISTDIAEPSALKIIEFATITSNQTIAQAVKKTAGKYNLEPVGTQKVVNAQGERITRKSDIQYSQRLTVSTTAAGQSSSKGFNIDMTVGISNKFYVGSGSKYLGGNNTPWTGDIHSGSGGSLASAIDETWHTIYNRYFAYNQFIHNNYSTNTYQLDRFILTKKFLSLFASAGQKDLAQLFIINGAVVSMWEVIKVMLGYKSEIDDIAAAACIRDQSSIDMNKIASLVLQPSGAAIVREHRRIRQNIDRTPLPNNVKDKDDETQFRSISRSNAIMDYVEKNVKIHANLHLSQLQRALARLKT